MHKTAKEFSTKSGINSCTHVKINHFRAHEVWLPPNGTLANRTNAELVYALCLRRCMSPACKCRTFSRPQINPPLRRSMHFPGSPQSRGRLGPECAGGCENSWRGWRCSSTRGDSSLSELQKGGFIDRKSPNVKTLAHLRRNSETSSVHSSTKTLRNIRI